MNIAKISDIFFAIYGCFFVVRIINDFMHFGGKKIILFEMIYDMFMVTEEVILFIISVSLMGLRKDWGFIILRVLVPALLGLMNAYQLGKINGKNEEKERRRNWIVNRDEELKKIAEKRKKKSIK